MGTAFGERLHRSQYLIANAFPRVLQIGEQQIDLVGNVDQCGARQLRQRVQNDHNEVLRWIFGQQIDAERLDEGGGVRVVMHVSQYGDQLQLHGDGRLQGLNH